MKHRLILMVLSLYLVPSFAQGQGSGPGQLRPGETVAGKVTAVTVDSLTVAPMNGGDPIIIKAGTDARILKQREPVKLSAIRLNDTVFARGHLTGNNLDAFMVVVVNPEMLQRIQQGGGLGVGAGAGQGQFKPEDWGKTFIAGQLKAINETTLTIARPDQQQTINIEVDENTSFKKGRESITLADIKPDDFVFGQGEVKNGVFVAKELRVGGGRMLRAGQPGGPPPEQKKPDSDGPATTPKD
ncbi:MAG TPA: DUF5666 domain-containing protein [Candidatus Angelobacter sp.]